MQGVDPVAQMRRRIDRLAQHGRIFHQRKPARLQHRVQRRLDHITRPAHGVQKRRHRPALPNRHPCFPQFGQNLTVHRFERRRKMRHDIAFGVQIGAARGA